MRKLAWGAGVVMLLIRCAPDYNNPIDPENPATNTLWSKILSADPPPDTLYYGAVASFTLGFGDNDGDVVTLTVEGLPPNQQPAVSRSGDQTVASFKLSFDSLAFDSTYSITLRATGEEPVDTLSLRYAVHLSDTTRLGGLKKLKVGFWWTETEYDTSFSTRDSSGMRAVTGDTLTHRRRSEVVDTLNRNGDLFYLIVVRDSVQRRADKPVVGLDSMLFRHTDSSLYYVVPFDTSGKDTLFIRFLALPLKEGTLWEALNFYDSIPLRILVPQKIYARKRTLSSVTDASTVPFGGALLPCLDAASLDTTIILLTQDTTVMNPIFPSVPLWKTGDTVSYYRAQTTGDYFVSPFLTLPLGSREFTVGFDTNYTNKTCRRDTVRKSVSVTSYYDPWRDTVFTQ